MPWFEGTHTESRVLPTSIDAAVAHFASPEALIAAAKDVESSAITDDVIHFVLKEEDHGVVKFKADYKCRYVRDGNTVTWETLDGNLNQSGKVSFTPEGDGCTMDYTETVKVDLGVPAMVAPMLKPVLGPMLAGEIKGFVDRMTKAL